MKMQFAIIPTDLLFVVVIPDFLAMVLSAQVHITLYVTKLVRMATESQALFLAD
jgi:hypothetical protein